MAENQAVTLRRARAADAFAPLTLADLHHCVKHPSVLPCVCQLAEDGGACSLPMRIDVTTPEQHNLRPTSAIHAPVGPRHEQFLERVNEKK